MRAETTGTAGAGPGSPIRAGHPPGQRLPEGQRLRESLRSRQAPSSPVAILEPLRGPGQSPSAAGAAVLERGARGVAVPPLPRLRCAHGAQGHHHLVRRAALVQLHHAGHHRRPPICGEGGRLAEPGACGCSPGPQICSWGSSEAASSILRDAPSPQHGAHLFAGGPWCGRSRSTGMCRSCPGPH